VVIGVQETIAKCYWLFFMLIIAGRARFLRTSRLNSFIWPIENALVTWRGQRTSTYSGNPVKLCRDWDRALQLLLFGEEPFPSHFPSLLPTGVEVVVGIIGHFLRYISFKAS